jgi:hypothetical protein
MNATKELDLRPAAQPDRNSRRSSSKGHQRLVLQEVGARQIGFKLPQSFKKFRFRQPA